MLGAACRSTRDSAIESELVWIWLVITVFCVYPGAQQLLKETWRTKQSVDCVCVFRASDEENLAPLRESSEKTTAHEGLYLMHAFSVFVCVCVCSAHLSPFLHLKLIWLIIL